MTKRKLIPIKLGLLDGPGYLPDYYKAAPEPEAEKEADRSGAPMLAHLEGAELESLLTLLQGMEEKEATQARASLARELAGRKGGEGSGHEGHAGIPGVQGGSLPGTGGSWAHHGGERDPIGYVNSGAYVRGKIMRAGKVDAKRRKEYRTRRDQMNAEYARLSGERMDIYKTVPKDQSERDTLEIRDRVIKDRLAVLTGKMETNSSTYWAANDAYRKSVHEQFKVNDPLQTPLNTGRLRAGMDRVRKGHEFFSNMVPNHMVQEAAPIQIKRGTLYKGQRAYYGLDGTINMPKHSSAGSTTHELGHWLEDHNPTIKGKASAFLAKRTQGEKAQKLNDVTGSKFYKDYEYTRKDDFLSPYMGRSYSDGSTEIISMGLEMMYNDPADLAQRDPEYFDFVWNTVRGIE